MKIKKVDDKPMVIHTKKKAKIHTHEPKKASIKASNIYTTRRSPKIKSRSRHLDFKHQNSIRNLDIWLNSFEKIKILN